MYVISEFWRGQSEKERSLAQIWRSFAGTYQIKKLVDRQVYEEIPRTGQHLVCDIDKTYLETQFETVLKMARIAFEDALDKVTVRGAAEVLLAARWGEARWQIGAGKARPLHFVSSSPPQLRQVLGEKLGLDGLDWSSDTLKNQAYNLRTGRLELLKQHIPYKTAAVLSLIADHQIEGDLLMIGDNAESDSFIYIGLKLYLAGRLSAEEFTKYMMVAGVDQATASDVAAIPIGPKRPRVQAILIRQVPNYPILTEPPLTDAAIGFDHYWDATIRLHQLKVICGQDLWRLARGFHNSHGVARSVLRKSLRAYQGASPEDIEWILQRLGEDQHAGDETSSPYTLPDLSKFDALKPSEILDHASRWYQRVRSRGE
jgi:hypothetical protein